VSYTNDIPASPVAIPVPILNLLDVPNPQAPLTSNVFVGLVVFIPTFPPVVVILPTVLLSNVALNPPLVTKILVALNVPVAIPIEAFSVLLLIFVPTALLNWREFVVTPVDAFKVPLLMFVPMQLLNLIVPAVKVVTFALLICADAEVIPVLAFIVPVEIAPVTALATANPAVLIAVPIASLYNSVPALITLTDTFPPVYMLEVMVPFTCNNEVGLLLPIPMFPELVTISLSKPLLLS
jgi:hypothetical protein